MVDGRARSMLRSRGVPDPDGTAVGDAEHTLALMTMIPDDRIILGATFNVYGDNDTTGISMGDLRELTRLARIGFVVERAVRETNS